MKKEQKIARIAEIARSLIGAPYVYGAYADLTTKKKPTGFDCSSLVQYVYAKAGILLPRSSLLQATKGKEIKNKKALQQGDLIFFEGTKGHYWHKKFKGKKIYIGHVAIYTGNGNVIDAEEDRGDVREIPLKNITVRPFYKIVLIKRYV